MRSSSGSLLMSMLDKLIDAAGGAIGWRWTGKRKGICRPSVGKVVALSEMFDDREAASSEDGQTGVPS